jgi:putative transposase
MPDSKQNSPLTKIEKEIYNIFTQYTQEKHIYIADFIEKLDISIIKHQEYRKIKFSYESLIRFILYQRLKKYRFITQTRQYLINHPDEAIQIGFKELPNRRQIGYFQNHILDNETKKLLDFIINKIEEITDKFGITLDIISLKPTKIEKPTKTRNQYYIKDKRTREICQLIKKRFSPFMDFKLNSNSLYKKKQFIDLMIHMGMTRDFAENGSKTFKEIQGQKNPNSDTLLYHIKNHNDLIEIQRMFFTLFEILWEMTKQTNVIDLRKSYDVAVDYTEWYFYGDRSAPMVVGKKPERGTTKCYKFATINIVESGKRFTLLAIPVGPFDTKEKIIKQIFNYALKRIKIKRVYVDRGFFDSTSINTIKKFRLKFLMPCTANARIKKLLEILPAPTVINDYEMENTLFNVVIVEDDEGNKRAFATNEQFNENDVDLAQRLFLLYGKRWGIETSYKVKKHSFLPKTTSKNYLIRIFYFLFSVLLYNLWLLADILIWLAIFGEVKQDHLITSKYFGTVLYTIDPGGG